MERGRLAEFIYYQNIFRILSKEHVAGALVDASEGAPVSYIFAAYTSKGWLYALADHFLIEMLVLVVEGC